MSRIYLATSWRNEHQPRILQLLRTAGHEVYDFRNPQRVCVQDAEDGQDRVEWLDEHVNTGFSWDEVDPAWRTWTPAEYVRGLQHPRARAGFHSDFDAMQWADVCVVLMPCGPSAALEAGWCAGAGKHVVVHVAGMREPDLMYLVADAFTLDDEALLAELQRVPGRPEQAPDWPTTTRLVTP